ncbi:MAG: Rab family GTPase [Promethearchaeota archaeon]
MSKVKIKNTFKILVLGAPGVGKTTLIEQYSDTLFEKDVAPKVGVNFFLKQIKIGGYNYRLQFWDFFNEEKFGSLHTLYYKGASAIFYIFDLSKPETFEYCQNHLKKVWNESKLIKCPVLLIGNKADLVENKKDIDRNKYKDFVRKEGLLGYIETSMNNINSVMDIVPIIIQNNLKKNYQVKFLVNSEEFEDIKRFAKLSHQSQSDFIRTAIWEKMRVMNAQSINKNSKKNINMEEDKLNLIELQKIRKLLEKLEKQ